VASRPLLRVVLLVGLLGAVAGAIVGIVAYFAIALWALRGSMPSGRDAAFVIAIGAAGGAVAGFLLGPLVGFGLLRHVPLGRAIAFTGLGTLAGLAASIATNGRHPLPLTVGGFLLGAVAARLLGSRREPAARSGEGRKADRSRGA
jgi:hypothetical protein